MAGNASTTGNHAMPVRKERWSSESASWSSSPSIIATSRSQSDTEARSLASRDTVTSGWRYWLARAPNVPAQSAFTCKKITLAKRLWPVVLVGLVVHGVAHRRWCLVEPGVGTVLSPRPETHRLQLWNDHPDGNKPRVQQFVRRQVGGKRFHARPSQVAQQGAEHDCVTRAVQGIGGQARRGVVAEKLERHRIFWPAHELSPLVWSAEIPGGIRQGSPWHVRPTSAERLQQRMRDSRFQVGSAGGSDKAGRLSVRGPLQDVDGGHAEIGRRVEDCDLGPGAPQQFDDLPLSVRHMAVSDHGQLELLQPGERDRITLEEFENRAGECGRHAGVRSAARRVREEEALGWNRVRVQSKVSKNCRDKHLGAGHQAHARRPPYRLVVNRHGDGARRVSQLGERTAREDAEVKSGPAELVRAGPDKVAATACSQRGVTLSGLDDRDRLG